MNFHIITLFPELIESAVRTGVVGQAVTQNVMDVRIYNPRAHTSDAHNSVDDRPFGGGDGMVMMIEPLAASVREAQNFIESQDPDGEQPPTRVIHLSPRGMPLTDGKVQSFARDYRNIILVCSRYAGADQRFINEYCDEEVSIGDYVISGGELAALVIVDAVGRQLEGVLGNPTSVAQDSFRKARLEAPLFTRPNDGKVPTSILSGDHARTAQWREGMAALTTLARRPDLLKHEPLTETEIKICEKLLETTSEAELETCGLPLNSVLSAALEKWT